MPLMKFCSKRGCSMKVPYGTKYCAEHAYLERADQENSRAFFANYKRENYDSLYHSKEWREIVNAQLKAEPECEICHAPASEVHHVRPHRGNKDLFFDMNNLASLCHDCHWRITQDEIRGRKADAKSQKSPKKRKIWY